MANALRERNVSLLRVVAYASIMLLQATHDCLRALSWPRHGEAMLRMNASRRHGRLRGHDDFNVSARRESSRRAQYTRALGSMYLTSLVIVCVCTGR
jgi:hypothetical protein